MQITKLKGLTGAAFLLMVGIVALGYLVAGGIKAFAEKDRYVTVKGLAEREVLANKVVWPLPFNSVGNNLSELYNTVEDKRNIIISFLKSNGITDEEIIVSAPMATDREAQSYVPDNMKYRYSVESLITVISSQVTKVIELKERQAELLKKGVVISEDYMSQTRFEFTQLNDLKPSMIEEATRNARAVAQKFADDSDSKLGGIRQAYQGQFTINNSDETTPQIKRVRVVTTVDYYLK